MDLPDAPIAKQGFYVAHEPLDNHGRETRCYMRDPDGYLIEVGQYTPAAVETFKRFLAAAEQA